MRSFEYADLEIRDGPESLGDQWETPGWLFEWITQCFGPLTIDVAASARNTKCERFYSRAVNGLIKPWTEQRGDRFFCNPPFSKIRPWIEKAGAELALPNGPRFGVFVLPGGRVEQSWMRILRNREAAGGAKVIEPPFRIRFGMGPEATAAGKSESSNREPSIVVPMWTLPEHWDRKTK